ncbi:hypothetical protein HRbin32_01815 [bacterium HR32]|nr:hypothetical protein HRbin32_01815 [bacterium HR32]
MELCGAGGPVVTTPRALRHQAQRLFVQQAPVPAAEQVGGPGGGDPHRVHPHPQLHGAVRGRFGRGPIAVAAVGEQHHHASRVLRGLGFQQVQGGEQPRAQLGPQLRGEARDPRQHPPTVLGEGYHHRSGAPEADNAHPHALGQPADELGSGALRSRDAGRRDVRLLHAAADVHHQDHGPPVRHRPGTLRTRRGQGRQDAGSEEPQQGASVGAGGREPPDACMQEPSPRAAAGREEVAHGQQRPESQQPQGRLPAERHGFARGGDGAGRRTRNRVP